MMHDNKLLFLDISSETYAATSSVPRELRTWTPEQSSPLILNYKPQVPPHLFLKDFRYTQFRGNVRLFLEEAEKNTSVNY